MGSASRVWTADIGAGVVLDLSGGVQLSPTLYARHQRGIGAGQ